MKLTTEGLLLREFDTADIGYELNPTYWGHGYATEAMRQLIVFAFDDLGLAELTARVVDTNAASLRVLERLGFGHAGRIWPQPTEYRLLRNS